MADSRVRARKIHYEPKASENKEVKKKKKKNGSISNEHKDQPEKLPGAKVVTWMTKYVTIALL